MDLAFKPVFDSIEDDTDWLIIRFLDTDAEFELSAEGDESCADWAT